MEEDSGKEEEEKDKDKAEDEVVEARKGRRGTKEDDWTSTANVLRETQKRTLNVPSGRKVGKETAVE